MIEKNEDWCNFENPNFSIDIFVAVCAWRALFRDRSIDNDLDEEKITLEKTGFEIINEMHAIAFIVVEEKDMITFRDVLKPHRGEVYIAN